MKPVDFQGITLLGSALVDQVQRYLREKESQLSHRIVHAIHPLPSESLPPVLPFSTSGHARLADAVEAFDKNIQQVAASKRSLVTPNDWDSASRQINNALWEYVEVLEGCVIELFQQLGQISFEHWNQDLIKVVEELRSTLDSRMEELIGKIPRLEALLWEYRWACEARMGKNTGLKRIFYFWKTLLDRILPSYVCKSRKFLRDRSKWFAYKYAEYLKLEAQIERSMRKFKNYQVFTSLDSHAQDEFKMIYNMLKLWHLNLRSKSLPAREPIRALRSAISVDKATELFKGYHQALRDALFERSRKFKKDPKDTYLDPSTKRIVQGVLKGYSAEIHTLAATIGRYRDFFLKTHPNPYVRTRWGFAEWVVGPEPQQTKELLHLEYAVETLDKLLEELNSALERGPKPTDATLLAALFQAVLDGLHEMGQPLASQSIIRTHAEKVLRQIQEMNELGSFNPEVVDYVNRAFSKALRVDWQYHSLFDLPLFYELYDIHQGIAGPIEDRQHMNRMKKFHTLIAQLEGWVKNRDTYRHIHEIETNMTDLKGFLQDFLPIVQRASREESSDKETEKKLLIKMTQQLLEYRVAFGKFFYFLHQHEPEGKLIRNQLLFVDQYFESVENWLQEIRSRLA